MISAPQLTDAHPRSGSPAQALVVALVGNPNAGKSTVFNGLTGARQHVGNYPGVTVERKSGQCRQGDTRFTVVDLPGTYSLTAVTLEEKVARGFLLEDRPEVAVNIIDATNLERNLYLTAQLMELGLPLVLAFNMTDTTRAMGMSFDIEKLAARFGGPVVQISGRTGEGLAELMVAAAERAVRGKEWTAPTIDYGPAMEAEIARWTPPLADDASPTQRRHARWLAIKLLEGDPELCARLAAAERGVLLEESRARVVASLGEEPASLIAAARYEYIARACEDAVRAPAAPRRTASDRLDAVLTHRWLGLPLFLGIMYLMFQLTFTVSAAPMEWIEAFFGGVGERLGGLWAEGSESPLRSLLVDGLIGGVGGVLVFMPNILCLFFAIAILEDSGYMARAAFLMDRLMHKIGLHGKSFIPMLIGFGCSVPAIMATRTLENRRDRLATMTVIPLMSCGARLPIYSLLIPAFFAPAWRAPMLWFIYVLGIMLAIAGAKLLRCTLLRGDSVPFLMELPPYRIPTARSVLTHMWERGWLYVRKAGTVILGISIVLWALTNYPKKAQFERDYARESAQAASLCLAQIKALAVSLGLEESDPRLPRAVRTRPGMEGVGEPGGVVPPAAANHAAAPSVTSGSDPARADGVVERFLAAVDSVAQARAAREVQGEVGTAGPAKPVTGDPAIETAAARYLERIETPYLEAERRLAEARQAELLAYSVAGRLGHVLEPVLAPLGFDWRIGTAFIGAFAAKEVFVAQMGIVFAVGEADETSGALREQLRASYTPLVAFCVMLFSLASTPCMATVAVTRKESGSWGWAIGQWVGLTVVAYFLTLFVYQTGRWLGY